VLSSRDISHLFFVADSDGMLQRDEIRNSFHSLIGEPQGKGDARRCRHMCYDKIALDMRYWF
jgi:hypothetical protein